MHWGELEAAPSSGVTVPRVEAASLSTKSQEVFIEGPKLHQPSAQQKVHLQQLAPELCRPDVLSLHTIQMLEHNRKVCTLFSSHQHGKWDDHGSKASSLQDVPRLSALKSQRSSSDSKKEDENKIRLSGYRLNTGTVDIDTSAARELSTKAVATICAHAGYENSYEGAVETLTDLLQEHLVSLCRLLRVAVDREALTGQTGFQDVLTQVLQDTGIGPTINLYNFWKTRIKNYHKLVEKRTSDLMERCERLKQPTSSESVFMGENIPEEDTFPAQIFALPEDNSIPNLTFEPLDGSLQGSELGSSGGTLPSWFKPVKIEPAETDDATSQENSNNDSVEDETGDSSSFVDGSSDVADVGSSPPWDGYQDAPLKKKRKK